jgi:hypothetical protein
MSVLGAIKTKKVILPSSTPGDENWVEVNIAMTIKDMISVDATTDEERSFAIIAKAIKDWSFTTAQGQKAEITPENIALLPSMDLIAINKALNFTTEEAAIAKKNS